ncbi:protein FAM111A-like isoform X2 [Poecilia reticulata]|nr:PREDICTED: protein FAM111A-like isoform X2 [Poecilia reticulata]
MNPTKVKKEGMEKDEASTDDHLHRFNVKFGSDPQKYTIDCKKPRTVLEVIKLKHSTKYEKEMEKPGEKKRLEENLIIKVGEGNDSYIVATHFPCSCLATDDCLTTTTSNNIIEKKQQQVRVLPREKYSVFFIDKEGGKDTKSKTDMIFRCNNIQQQFRYFCVYGRKGMTVEEALTRDGRFVDGLTDFTLSDNKTGDVTNYTEIVDNLDGKEFQICLPRKGKTKATNPPQVVQEQDSTQQTSQEQRQEENASASTKVQNIEVTKVLEYARQKGISGKTSIEDLKIQIDLNEINDLLRKQFPKLKALMESRFPGRSFEETLKLKRENFGKIQNSFSEVHTVRELLNLSKSICLLMIEEKNNSGLTELKKTVQGTGFVLFDNFVLTNAHLFEPWEKMNNWVNYLTVTAEFSFESKGKPGMKYQATVVGGTHDLDFALLELTQLPGQAEGQIIPPGLLKIFGPIPGGDGGACIIGHPAGGVKKMDITCIIRKEDKEQAVKQNLASHEPFIVCSTNYQIKRDTNADIHVTYNSFMYHGSSGSPVFDAVGQVFGLHSGGFFYNTVIPGHSVMEYAYPLLDIFKKLLGELQKTDKWDLLERIMNEATGNPYLEMILESVGLKQTKVQALCVENRERTDETGEQSDYVEEMDQS